MPLQNIRILNPDGSISAPSTSMGSSETQQIIRLVQEQQQQRQVQQFRVVNSDGTVSTIAAPIVQSQPQQPTQQQQIRIVKMDQNQQTQATPQQQQQIRILNADGTVSNLGGNVRIVQSASGSGPKQYRVIQTSEEGAAALQAQQGGGKAIVLNQSQGISVLNSPTKVQISEGSGGAMRQIVVGGAQQQSQQQVLF